MMLRGGRTRSLTSAEEAKERMQSVLFALNECNLVQSAFDRCRKRDLKKLKSLMLVQAFKGMEQGRKDYARKRR